MTAVAILSTAYAVFSFLIDLSWLLYVWIPIGNKRAQITIPLYNIAVIAYDLLCTWPFRYEKKGVENDGERRENNDDKTFFCFSLKSPFFIWKIML